MLIFLTKKSKDDYNTTGFGQACTGNEKFKV